MAGKKNGANKAVKTKRVKAKTNWILCIAVIALVDYQLFPFAAVRHIGL